MTRYGLIAVLVLAAAAGGAPVGAQNQKEMRFEGKLTQDDPKDRKRNAAFKVHMVKLTAGNSYTIDMVSNTFDNYLRLEDKKGKELAEDDDSGGMQNARIIFSCQKTDEYKIICTAFDPNGMGPYVLTVKMTGVAPKLITAHSALIGKEAPDFRGDFVLNGQVKRLADLKGKVVLLDFWAVFSNASAAAFPKLLEWHKAHKDEGLEVVGVSFYNYENGQHIGFDKTTGKLTKLDETDRKAEREMLRAFAKHHKLDYLLMVLEKEDALKTFNDYFVNGLPEFVLIDRQGNVRAIVVGERNVASLEAEIKKVLAEK
jgi:thiol-disulfide isomerase/thioredoxin